MIPFPNSNLKHCGSAACATVAEVRKRGEDFWQEFEFYLSDLVVGLVLDVVLVGLMATPAVISRHHKAHKSTGILTLPASLTCLVDNTFITSKTSKNTAMYSPGLC